MQVNILHELRDGPWGGGNQFLKSLRDYLVSRNAYEEDPERADIILFNSFPFGEYWRFIQAYKLKSKGKIIIHRIDGPISKIRGQDPRLDGFIYTFNDLLSDGTVFQSNWSRNENLESGLKKKDFEATILNAPDPELFNRKEKKRAQLNGKIRLIATSWSSNWNKGFHVYKWLDENLDFGTYEMTFIGNSPIKFKNIKYIKSLPSNELALEVKKHDIFITASKNDPCSNALIEALHCGLPAIAYADGGHPEIVRGGGELFTQKDEIPLLLEKIVTHYKSYQNNIVLPSMDEIGSDYYNFLSRIYDSFINRQYIPIKNDALVFGKLMLGVYCWRLWHKFSESQVFVDAQSLRN